LNRKFSLLQPTVPAQQPPRICPLKLGIALKKDAKNYRTLRSNSYFRTGRDLGGLNGNNPPANVFWLKHHSDFLPSQA